MAIKSGLSLEAIDREIIIPDGLTEWIWPVYPEVGERLGLAGSYIWRNDNKELFGPLEFLHAAYDAYERQHIRPNELAEVVAVSDNIDAVLRARL